MVNCILMAMLATLLGMFCILFRCVLFTQFVTDVIGGNHCRRSRAGQRLNCTHFHISNGRRASTCFVRSARLSSIWSLELVSGQGSGMRL